MEQLLIKNIEAGIRGIRFRTKIPEDIEETIQSNLKRLKSINDGMHDELLKRWDNAKEDYNKSKKVVK